MRVALLTTNRIGDQMAGPAIRAVEFGRLLAVDHDVTVASLTGADPIDDIVAPGALDRDGAVALFARVDVVVAQGVTLERFHDLIPNRVVVVSDLYDPYQLEGLEAHRGQAIDRRLAHLDAAHAAFRHHLVRGDIFLCASERQRHFWLGQLDLVDRLNPATYDADPTLRSFVRTVPFGSPDHACERTGPGVRGTAAVPADAKIVLWSGGIHDWFDPIVVVDAVDRLRSEVPTIRLVFLGIDHPDQDERRPVILRLEERAKELGMLGNEVVLLPGWFPYAERQNVLLDADVAITTHPAHLETEFSYRTRVLDHVWASLPSVMTAGDTLADRIGTAGAGVIVPPNDVDAVAAALRSLLTDDAAHARAVEATASLRDETRWSVAAAPLLDAVAHARRAPDLVDPVLAARIARHRPPEPGISDRVRNTIGAARERASTDGLGGVASAVVRRLRRLRDR